MLPHACWRATKELGRRAFAPAPVREQDWDAGASRELPVELTLGRRSCQGDAWSFCCSAEVGEEVSPGPRCASAADPRLPVAALEGDPPKGALCATAAEAHDEPVGEQRDQLARTAAMPTNETVKGESAPQQVSPTRARRAFRSAKVVGELWQRDGLRRLRARLGGLCGRPCAPGTVRSCHAAAGARTP